MELLGFPDNSADYSGIYEGHYPDDEEDEEPLPRAWSSLTDVPVGVRVTDKDDDGVYWVRDESREYDVYGPFTEVLA